MFKLEKIARATLTAAVLHLLVLLVLSVVLVLVLTGCSDDGRTDGRASVKAQRNAQFAALATADAAGVIVTVTR